MQLRAGKLPLNHFRGKIGPLYDIFRTGSHMHDQCLMKEVWLFNQQGRTTVEAVSHSLISISTRVIVFPCV